MIEEKEKKEIEESLERICSHRLFATSSTNIKLLRYLVEKAFLGEDIKEFSIGTDLWGKNYGAGNNDGIVRSYVYKLRKKLNEYYNEPDTNEPIIFEIKKGQYNLNFVVNNASRKLDKNKKKSISIPTIYLKISGLVIVGIFIFGFILNHVLNRHARCWESFFEKNARNLVIVSDQFILLEKNQWNELHATMYYEINSFDEYLDYIRKQPERDIRTTDFTLMSQMAPWSVKRLTHWFVTQNSDFNLQLESKLKYDEIRNNNIIFIGQFKTMSNSKSLFLKNSKVFKTYLDGFKYNDGKSEKIYNTRYDRKGKIEYAMVSFTSLSPNTSAFYFVSNNDIGVIATVRNFTDHQWLKAFYKNLPKNTQYFNALYEVQGIQRTDLNCKLVELEILENE